MGWTNNLQNEDNYGRLKNRPTETEGRMDGWTDLRGLITNEFVCSCFFNGICRLYTVAI